MYLNGTKCTSLVLGALLSLSATAKEAKNTDMAHGLKKPVCFVENKGQITDQENNPRTDIQYKLSTPGMSLFVGNGQLHYQFRKTEGIGTTAAEASIYRMDVTLMGANANALVTNEEKQAYQENYFYPQFGDNGMQANAYNKITYHNVYPNIDWVIYVKQNKVEYDFVVREGGNINNIKLKYSGATKLSEGKDGSIVAETPMGSVAEKAPYAYENNTKKHVDAHFKVQDNVVSFETGNYNGALTIDPYLEWSTYFGGAGEDVATGIRQTSAGVVFVSGYTASTGLATLGAFNTTNAGVTYDAFAARYSAAGVLQVVTYYGGTGTNTQGTGLVLDNAATPNVYLVGYTTSSGLEAGPTIHQASNGGLNDVFLVKLNNTLTTRTWCTYYGGTGDDYAYGITIDASNNIYVAGQTASTTSISSPGAYQTSLSGPADGFLAKFNTTYGSVTWATYYGGTAQETAYGVACDASNNPYITGQTNSITGIATTGAYDTVLNGTNDAFVAKFSTAGALDWGTYYGGENTDQGNGIVYNSTTGDIVIAGNTVSTTGIASAYATQSTYGGGSQDGFLASFANGTGMLDWGTYAGGTGLDYGQAVCLDSFKNIVLAGGTYSTSNIATTGEYQTTLGGDYDAFISKYTPYGQKLWGTYFGGAYYDYANAVACAPMDQIVIAGYTSSLSGVTTTGAAQTTYGGGTYDALIAKFYRDTLVSINQPFTDTLVCAGGTLNVYYTAHFDFQPGNTFTVQLSNALGSFASAATIGSVTTPSSGTIVCTIPSGISGTGYRIQIIASDPAFTSPDNLYNIDIVSGLSPTVASGTTPVCAGDSVYLYDSASYIVTAYNWSGPDGFASADQNPSLASVTTANAGTYYVTTSHNGCPDITDSTTITVNTFIPPTPIDSVSGSCEFGTISLFANPDTSLSGITYYWTGPNGFTSTAQDPVITSASMLDAGYYFLVDTFQECASAYSYIYVPVNPSSASTISISAIPGDTICQGASITFTATATDAGIDPGFQWMIGSTPIVGAISSTFTSLDAVNGTQIWCELFSNATCPSQPSFNSDTITVTVLNNTPLAYIGASTGSIITDGDSVVFTSSVANPGTAPTYEWIVNGVADTTTSTSFTVHSISSNDTVQLIVFTTNTCASPDSAISNTIIINPYPASVAPVSVMDNVSLYPNPNNGNFTISGNVAGISANSVLLEIDNALGEKVYSDNASITNHNISKQININNLASGIYLLHISDNAGESKVIRFSIAR